MGNLSQEMGLKVAHSCTSSPSAKVNKKGSATANGKLIQEPRPEDILCGKEKHCVSHSGSLNFRVVIDSYATKYQEAITKQEKMNVTKEIYDSLGSQNARFLKYNAEAKAWEELSSLLARDKISHALRFANREKKTAAASFGACTTPKSKKGHRRNGSEGSTSTLTTVATELSLEEFDELMDDEPLEWKPDSETSATATASEPEVYVYEVSYESVPPPPTAATYHSYGPLNYYHQYPYGHSPRPYYYPHYHHHQQQPCYHDYGPPPASPVRREETEEEQPMTAFPEKPHPEPPARKSSMDVDLTYMMSEPLMEWDLETDEVYVIQ